MATCGEAAGAWAGVGLHLLLLLLPASPSAGIAEWSWVKLQVELVYCSVVRIQAIHVLA
jgi:hypothetical protein